jgi:hypothetical protein
MVPEERSPQDLLEHEWADHGDPRESGEGVGSGRVDQRIDQDHLFDEVGVLGGERKSDRSAQSASAQGEADQPESCGQVDQGFGERVEVVSIAARSRLFALSKTGQIGRYDVKTARQPLQDVVPLQSACQAIVHEHEGRAPARLHEPDASAAGRHVAGV